MLPKLPRALIVLGASALGLAIIMNLTDAPEELFRPVIGVGFFGLLLGGVVWLFAKD